MSDVPPGWEKFKSQSTGKDYYYHAATNTSQWEKPQFKKDSDETNAYNKSIRASHILVKHNKSRRPSSWRQQQIIRSQGEALETILDYRKKLIAQSDLFEEYARLYSDCSSANRDGDLGYFTFSQMQKPFSEAAYKLSIGQISNPVFTESGIHLIKRTE